VGAEVCLPEIHRGDAAVHVPQLSIDQTRLNGFHLLRRLEACGSRDIAAARAGLAERPSSSWTGSKE